MDHYVVCMLLWVWGSESIVGVGSCSFVIAGDPTGLTRHPDVALRWIRAHDGSRWNEYADAVANRYLEER